MDDFLGNAIPSAIADEPRQGLKRARPQPSRSRMFNRIRVVAARDRKVLAKRSGAIAALTACLFGLAWLGSSNIRRPAPVIRSAEINFLGQKGTQESHAERAEVGAIGAAQSLNTEKVRAAETAKPGLEAAKTEAGPGIVDAGKTRRLTAKAMEQLAKGGERVDRIGLEIAALLAVDPRTDHSASATTPRKRGQSARGDAFDPSQHPNAPGAPRPLGTIRFTAPVTKSSADYAYGRPAD
jgi:hypothetical protein